MQPKRSDAEPGRSDGPTLVAATSATPTQPPGLAEAQAGFSSAGFDATTPLTSARPAPAPGQDDPALLYLAMCTRMVDRRVELLGECARCTSPVELGQVITRWTTKRIEETVADQQRLMEAMMAHWTKGFAPFLPSKD